MRPLCTVGEARAWSGRARVVGQGHGQVRKEAVTPSQTGSHPSSVADGMLQAHSSGAPGSPEKGVGPGPEAGSLAGPEPRPPPGHTCSYVLCAQREPLLGQGWDGANQGHSTFLPAARGSRWALAGSRRPWDEFLTKAACRHHLLTPQAALEGVRAPST